MTEKIEKPKIAQPRARSQPYMDFVAQQLKEDEKKKQTYISFKQRTRSQISEWALWFMPKWFPTPLCDFDDQFNLELEETLLHKHVSMDRPYRRVYGCSRGYHKTTKTQYGMLWAATEGVKSGQIKLTAKMGDELIFYLTQKDDLAFQKMEAVWSELKKNQSIRERYGDLMSGGNPKDGLRMTLSNNVQLDAGGLLGSRMGKHPANLILDDPESKRDAQSPAKREKMWDRWTHELCPMMGPGSATFVTGMPIDPLCILLLIGKQANSITSFRKAIENGQSILPTKFSLEYLKYLRKEMGDDAFFTEFMCEPRAGTPSPIKHYMIQFYDPFAFPLKWYFSPGFLRVTFVDVAFKTKEINDYSAIVTVAAAHRSLDSVVSEKTELAAPQVEPSFFFIEAKRGHWTPDEVLDELYLTYQKFRPHNIFMEEAGGSIIYEDLYRQRVATHHQVFPFELQPHNEFGPDKTSRIICSSPHWNQHMVFCNQECPVQYRMIQELVKFDPRDTSLKKDLADAGTGAINNAHALIGVQVSPPGGREPQPIFDDVTGDFLGYR